MDNKANRITNVSTKKVGQKDKRVKRKKVARTVEARERSMIIDAITLAEKKLKDGTASSQIIVHYLKLASPDAKTEREILQAKKDFLIAKTKSLTRADELEKLTRDALEAIRSYNPEGTGK